jgi:hypothetical protein
MATGKKAMKAAKRKHPNAAKNAKMGKTAWHASPARIKASAPSAISCPSHTPFFSCPTCSPATLLLYFAGLAILIYGQMLPNGAEFMFVAATLLLVLSFAGPWIAARLGR